MGQPTRKKPTQPSRLRWFTAGVACTLALSFAAAHYGDMSASYVTALTDKAVANMQQLQHRPLYPAKPANAQATATENSNALGMLIFQTTSKP